MTHTPGPWTARPDSGQIVLNGANIYAVQEICNEQGWFNPDDIRLMAAGPELLAALRLVKAELIDSYEEHHPDDESDNDITAAIDAAIAAIAKAEGR